MSESALCRAVRDQIRAHAGFEERQCDVELDESVPPVAGPVYVMVITAGYQAGPTQGTNFGAADKLYNVDVAVAMRAPKFPHDRQRRMFLALTKSFEVYVRMIEAQIDFQQAVRVAANTYISDETGSTEGFITPLVFDNVSPFRRASGALFQSDGGEPVAAVIRTIHYRGARRIVTRDC